MSKREPIQSFEHFDSTVYHDALPTKYRAPTVQIKAAAGLGKTRTIIQQVSENSLWRSGEVNFYTPNMEHADEIEAIATSAGLHVKRISGRSPSPASSGYCPRFDVADKAAKLGMNVYQSCCQTFYYVDELRCPHFKNCSYLRQWQDDKPAFRIFVHNYIFLPRPRPNGVELPNPILNIVDESVVQRAVKELAFGVDRMDGPYADAARVNLETGKDYRLALIELGVTMEAVNAKAIEVDPSCTPKITPTHDDKYALQILGECEENEANKLAAFYRRIAAELNLGRSFHGIEIVKDEKVQVNGRWERQNRIHVHELAECYLDENVPLLIIDADAALDLNRRIFDREIDHVEINAKRRAHVVQCSSTSLSVRTLLGPSPKDAPQLTPSLEKVEKIVEHEAVAAARVLVVMPLKVRDALRKLGRLTSTTSAEGELWRGASVAHFGAIRGKDVWKDFDTIVVLSRNQPPPIAIDRLARAIYCDDNKPLLLVGQGQFFRPLRGYRLRNRTHWGVPTAAHPDRRAQGLLELIREQESSQAIDRLRLIHAESVKRVVILCSIPLNITVDELRTLDELAGTPDRLGPRTRLETAMERAGIVPTGARDLARAFPDLFPSAARAKDALRETRAAAGGGSNGGEFLIDILLGSHPHLGTGAHEFRKITYRRAGQRGKASHAIIDARHHTPEIARAALEALLRDPMAAFEITTDPDEPPPT